VVVDDVEQHREPTCVRGVHESLQAVGPLRRAREARTDRRRRTPSRARPETRSPA
jgi:hypothetical protein